MSELKQTKKEVATLINPVLEALTDTWWMPSTDLIEKTGIPLIQYGKQVGTTTENPLFVTTLGDYSNEGTAAKFKEGSVTENDIAFIPPNFAHDVDINSVVKTLNQQGIKARNVPFEKGVRDNHGNDDFDGKTKGNALVIDTSGDAKDKAAALHDTFAKELAAKKAKGTNGYEVRTNPLNAAVTSVIDTIDAFIATHPETGKALNPELAAEIIGKFEKAIAEKKEILGITDDAKGFAGKYAVRGAAEPRQP